MPDRVLRAMDRAALDHRGPEFAAIVAACQDGLRHLYKTTRPVVIYPAAGHGAWEAALTNTSSPGDTILMAETGAFSGWWREMAESFGITVEYLAGDWRHGADPEAIEARLAEDRAGVIKAVAVVHNETSTGVTSRIADVGRAIDRASHPALFLVDNISSLASMDFRMDEWRIDVAIGGAQKGLMLPPGLGFTAVSEKAFRASQSARLPRNYWDWRAQLPDGLTPTFTCTPAVNLFFGLKESLDMLLEEGLDEVFARHARLAEAVRRAVRAWGLDLQSADPREHSNSVSAIRMPDGHDAEMVREACHSRANVVLAGGLRKLAGRVFRIGHLGDLNEPMILGTLAATELALAATSAPHTPGGTTAAIRYLAEN
jgi:alanine-glyoxylate transaminase/serine-glyoxylate transaminase/serine-pyruvate transaminase